MSSILIPLAPLAGYIDQLGGVAALPGMGRQVEVEVEKPPYLRVKMERTFEEERRYQSLRKKLNHAKVRGGGVIDLFEVDAICCEILGVHPMQVYGEAWFDFEPAVAEIVAVVA